MKRWTTIMACALTLGFAGAPMSVYAEQHGDGQAEEAAAEGMEAAAEGMEGAKSETEEAAPEASEGGDKEMDHEGSH